jgi:hypothetical protein
MRRSPAGCAKALISLNTAPGEFFLVRERSARTGVWSRGGIRALATPSGECPSLAGYDLQLAVGRFAKAGIAAIDRGTACSGRSAEC